MPLFELCEKYLDFFFRLFVFHLKEGNRGENKISFKKGNEGDAVSGISNTNRKKRVFASFKRTRSALIGRDVQHSFFFFAR